MALTLYLHPLSSYCHKVLIALYENQTPFHPHIVNLGDGQDRADFAALWPTSKIPLLRDEVAKRIVPETSIIIEYLDRHYPGVHPLLPLDETIRLEARLWDRLFDNYVMTPMQKIVASRMSPTETTHRVVAEATATLKTAYDMIERQMANKLWAAGEAFSIADCAAAPSLFYASIAVPFSGSHQHLAAYFERLMSRASIKRVIAEARPYFHFFPLNDAMPARFLT
jgi:glutathione S-transferase